MSTITVLDSSGTPVVVNTPNADGPLTAANSRSVVLASDHPSVPVVASNITTKFREAFEDPALSAFNVTTGTGDIVQVDGNAAAASYLTISKSPWDAGNQTTLESIATFGMPIELAFGASRSQNTLGQEFAVEIVDTATPLDPVADIAISSITQAASVLTVETATDHGLVPGKAIGIVGCSNQLANYPSLVVATIPSPRQFTVTAGPGGTIPSQTITNPAGAKGSVFFRERLGRAQNGVSQIFENATVTNASFYLRSESGDALPSGTIAGNHAITVATTLPVAAVSAPYTYAFQPSSEYRLNVQADRVQATDSPVDSLAAAASRLMRTQVCPDPSATYELRIRANNSKSLTVLTAKVTSVVKTGTTTGTFTTATAHGLATGDLITYYGNSNVAAAAFPNLTVATAATVTGANTFTAVIGTASTVTGYGGVIAKVQAGNLPSALGANAVTGISAALSTLTNGTRQLVLTGSATWAGLVIGDYVNVEGVTDVTTGAPLGVDGAWKVANFVTSALTLVPCTATFAASLPANFGTTTSGGAVIKRTCLRLSYIRVFDYERQRVEVLARPTGDISGAVPVVLQGGTTAVSGSLTTLSTVTAVTAITNALPVGANTIGRVELAPTAPVADVASGAITTTTTVAALTPSLGISYASQVIVTAVSGTNPTMDIRIEESEDGGTNWHTVYDFGRITAAGIYRGPFLPVSGNRVRYVQTIGGTTPSFTRAIQRLQSNMPVIPVRQLIDRTIVPNTINSATPALVARDCGNATQLVVNMGAITTTAPAFQLEGSEDLGATWYPIGTPLTGVASSTVQLTVLDVNASLVRARVSTAGVGATLGYVCVKAHD